MSGSKNAIMVSQSVQKNAWFTRGRCSLVVDNPPPVQGDYFLVRRLAAMLPITPRESNARVLGSGAEEEAIATPLLPLARVYWKAKVPESLIPQGVNDCPEVVDPNNAPPLSKTFSVAPAL